MEEKNVREFDLDLNKETYTPDEVKGFLEQKTKFDQSNFAKKIETEFVAKNKYDEIEGELSTFKKKETSKLNDKLSADAGIQDLDTFKEFKVYDEFVGLKTNEEKQEFLENLKATKPSLFTSKGTAPELKKTTIKKPVVEKEPETKKEYKFAGRFQ